MIGLPKMVILNENGQNFLYFCPFFFYISGQKFLMKRSDSKYRGGLGQGKPRNTM
jgi:hypothetical protein